MSEAPKLLPPQAKGHHTVVRIENAWYAAAFSSELRQKPLPSTVLGVPLVLFRDKLGAAAAVVDRCPHRNVPLSLGRVRDGELECAYHGWRFGKDGACVCVPGLGAQATTVRARSAAAYPTRESDGLVWVWMKPDAPPTEGPYRFPHADDRAFTTVRRRVVAQSTMHAVLENTLDVPHTAFLHRGLFRGGGKQSELTAIVRHIPNGVEAEYVGEKSPSGLVGRILAPRGGNIVHFDRFLLPHIAQVEYRLEDSAVFVTSTHTPVNDFHTVVHVLVTFKLPIPHWLIKPFLIPISERIWKQDARILDAQRRTIAAFGGEQFAHTELDVLGPAILRKLLEAERGDAITTAPDQRITLSV